MPWRGPEVPGEFATLGYEVADWIHDTCVIPDGDRAGQPLVLTAEMVRFLLHYYRLDPERYSRKWEGPAFHFGRGGQLVRPQKWGKGPFSAAIVLAEAYGPVVPAGWDAHGEPVGRPWATPHVQCAAISLDQTANVWRVLQPMIELGDLVAEIPDTGLSRVNLPGGGLIEPVTSAGVSRLGQRVTFVVQDEPHSWTRRNGGRLLADNQRRNLAGVGGRFLETGNAWDPTEDSVAQSTNTEPGVFVDYPPVPKGSVRNKRERRKVMRAVYGDSVRDGSTDWGEWHGWVDLDRIDGEIEALLDRDPAQAERFFLNRVHAGESTAFDLERWQASARPKLVIPDGELIVLGVDGARFRDALAVVATDVVSGHQWPVTIVERPDNAAEDYEHDLVAVDGAVAEVFDRFEVWRVYIDPQWIEGLVATWQGRYGEKVVLPWYTNRPRQVGYAVLRYREAIARGDFTNDGDPVMARHIGQARRFRLDAKDDEGKPLFSIAKESRDSTLKIDAAMAGVLSREARTDAVAAGARKKPPPFAPRRIR